MAKITEIKFTPERIAEIMAARGPNEQEAISGKVLAIVGHPNGDQTIIHGLNIVTNFGDLYYAQNGAGESHTVSFHDTGGLRLGTSETAPGKTDIDVTTFIAGSGKAITAGYPKTADADVRNTGDGTDIVTWLYEYAAGEATDAAIAEGAIVSNLTTPAAGGCLTHFLFAAPFAKAAADTLAVFVNHQFNGV